MKIKKRYLILGLISTGLFATCKMEFLKCRQNEEKQRASLLKNGQADVNFWTYEINGQHIHCTRTGSNTSSLVLMVHGSPGSSSACLGYLSDTALTRLAQVVSVDRPGFGYSGFGKAEGSLGKQAVALKPILEAHKTGKRILVGHSYGGPVIVRMAMYFPELVDGLVIVAGSVDPELEPHYWWQKPLEWPVFRWMLPPAFRVSNQEILPLKEELREMLPRWKDITCPVTVIQGMKDDLVDPDNADFAKKMLANSHRVEIDTLRNDNHFIFWTKQDRITRKIIDLLNVDKK